MASQNKRIPALLCIGICLMLLLAFPAPIEAVVGAVRVAAVQDGQHVPQATISVFQGEELVATEDTDRSGVAYIPLEEGEYTLVTEFSGKSIREKITVTAGTLASFTADVGRGAIEPNTASLDRYNSIQASKAEKGYSVSSGDFNGLLSIRIDSPHGQIFLGFPYHAQAGETVSWSAIVVAQGKNAKDMKKSEEKLYEHVVVVNGQSFALQESTNWTMVITDHAKIAVLEKKRGKTVIEFSIAFVIQDTVTDSVQSGQVYFATAGWPVRVPGEFDGIAANTQIHFGGTPVDVVAETSMGVVFNPPSDLTGLQQVTISEGGNTQECMVQSAGLELSADKLELLKGETTALHLKILGLEEVSGTVYVSLFNNTPSVGSMSQGNLQFFVIDPKAVGPGGVVNYERTLTGIRRGQFYIVAILTTF